MRTKFVKGAYNCICDRCGYKFKSFELQMTWDNLLVCSDDWEPRHPQDFVRAKRDRQRVPIPRPEQVDTFTQETTTGPPVTFGGDTVTLGGEEVSFGGS